MMRRHCAYSKAGCQRRFNCIKRQLVAAASAGSGTTASSGRIERARSMWCFWPSAPAASAGWLGHRWPFECDGELVSLGGFAGVQGNISLNELS